MQKTLQCVVEIDAITQQISEAFDYQFNGHSVFSVPEFPANLPEEYGLGLIVGPSGSGKTTLLKTMGSIKTIDWNNKKSIASHFSNAEEAQERLSAVGLNSIPTWLRPYEVLSEGEKFRANLARQLGHQVCIDEFTSVVDRQVAKSCAYALRRFVNKNKISRLTVASCHYDIIEWLQPDWYFDLATNQLTRGHLQCRPTIELEFIPCSAKAWPLFSNHHYLSASINKASRCWLVTWAGQAIGFTSALAMPQVKSSWREHRTVVLPDFQGLGIGVRISDAIGELFLAENLRYFSKTAHPRMGQYRDNSPLWRPTSKNHMKRKDYSAGRITKEQKYCMRHANRWCYSHEYIGK